MTIKTISRLMSRRAARERIRAMLASDSEEKRAHEEKADKCDMLAKRFAKSKSAIEHAVEVKEGEYYE